MNRFVLLAGACLALAACNSEPAPDAKKTGGQNGAQGEVLGGTISDAMIPLDSVTSQSPPKQIESRAGDAENANAPAGDTGQGQQSDEPAAEPEPDPVPAEETGE